MILIADSGSTKCNWAACNKEGNVIKKYKTIGFHPYFITEKEILEELNSSGLKNLKEEITAVFFYGAGCSSKELNQIIKNPFKDFFLNAKVNIYHDLNAACYSMYDGDPAIICILGTGSNSCLFDGKQIYQHAPALGFILGDEASGNYFGRKIINLYFNNQLDYKLRSIYEKKYKTDIVTIKSNVYNNSRPNAFLANFFPFVSENKKHPQIQKIISDALNIFFTLHIKCFENYKDMKIHFIGSVAFFLKDEILKVSKNHKCNIGNIVRDPLEKLIHYHFNI